MEIGLIGFGQLGRFAASHLKEHFAVSVTDKLDKGDEAKQMGVKFTPIAEICHKDIVIISVPINQFESTLRLISDKLKKGCLVMDVCSVKSKPAEMMRRILPADVDIIATHPLFGPQSGANGIVGLEIVLCEIRGGMMAQVQEFLKSKLKLKVIVTTPEEHDRQMAMTGALAHFIGRALLDMSIEQQKITEPSFRKLMELKAMLEEDSFELFQDIQQNNPFAKEERDKLILALEGLKRKIEECRT